MDLPIRLIWISSVFLIIGGGSTVTNAVLTMVLTDATPTLMRSRVFLYFTASNLASEMVAPPIASYFIDKDVWIPLSIGLVCTMLTVIIASNVPETLPMLDKKKAALHIAVSDSDEESMSSSDAQSGRVPTWLRNPMRHAVKTFIYIGHNRPLFILVFTFLVSDFARQSLQVLLQYVSIRYNVTLAEVCQKSCCLSFHPQIEST
jgi:hypothetical protein